MLAVQKSLLEVTPSWQLSELRLIFTGQVTTVYSIANVIGATTRGAFAEHTTRRWCFYFNLPFGGTSALIILLFFRSPKTVRPKQSVAFWKRLSQLDPVGMVLALAGLVSFRSSFTARWYYQERWNQPRSLHFQCLHSSWRKPSVMIVQQWSRVCSKSGLL